MIPFTKTSIVGNEKKYIDQCIQSGQLAGDGFFTKAVGNWFSDNLGIQRSLLTTSCSMSLDMSAILLNIQPGDEVIMPSFTFVSTANAFVLRGARVKFVDIRPDTLNLDENLIEQAITSKTRAIVPVHYAGVSCEMDRINEIAVHHKIAVVEDAAQGVHSKYRGRWLGTLGDIGCFSFHGTKNYTSGGEGGLIILKNEDDFHRAEIIREKGTNRSQFFRGAVDKYSWVDVGSSFLPSDLSAAFLLGQLEKFDEINQKRMKVWTTYQGFLTQFSDKIVLPDIPEHCEHNAHMFHIRFKKAEVVDVFIQFAKKRGIIAPFHYVPLHASAYGQRNTEFIGEDRYTTLESSKLVRLPLYYGMSEEEVAQVCSILEDFFKTL